jgi:putative membrane protein
LLISVFYDARKNLRPLIFIIPAFIVARSEASAWVSDVLPFALVVGAVVIVVSPTVRWLRTTYNVEGNTLIIQGGLLSRWRRVIPRSRIQSVDLVEKLRHRVFGVVEVRVEAIGGSETEAALHALLPQQAQSLRRWALSDAPEESAEEPLVLLTPRDLVVAGVTGGRVAVLAVLFGYLFELLPEDYLDDVFEGVAAWARSAAVLAVAAAVLVLLVSFALSVAATVLIYWEFTVVRQGDRLVITRGLLDKRHATVPLPRVQAVFLNENLIRRMFGLASLTVHVAGYAGDKKEVEESSMLLPVGKRAQALRLAAEVYGVPDDVLVGPLDRPPTRAVTTRMFFGGLSGVVAVAWAVGPFGLGALRALLATVPIGMAVGYLRYRSIGYRLFDGWVVVRQGVVVRTTAFVPPANVQHLELRANPLQRALGLGSLRLALAKKSATAVDLAITKGREEFGRLAVSI